MDFWLSPFHGGRTDAAVTETLTAVTIIAPVMSLLSMVQVDVTAEEDEFQAVITACLNVIILAVETRLETPLQQMVRMPWSTMEAVSYPLQPRSPHDTS